MKYLTTDSKYLEKFDIWSVRFYTLLKKEEYEEIYNLTEKQINKKIDDLKLKKEDLINLRETLGDKNHCFWSITLNKNANEYKQYVLLKSGIILYKKSLELKKKILNEEIKENQEILNRLN